MWQVLIKVRGVWVSKGVYSSAAEARAAAAQLDRRHTIRILPA